MYNCILYIEYIIYADLLPCAMCSLLSVYQLIEVLCCLLTLISLSMIFEGEGIQLKELSPGIFNKEYPLCQIKVLDFNQKHQTLHFVVSSL